MRRVLITGSRDWAYPIRVYAALNKELLHPDSADGIVVINGMCPSGADLHAHEWYLMYAENPWVQEDPHPANWERPCDSNCYHKPRTKNGRPYCPMAGHLRNQDMVDTGADVCLAFPLEDSRGTKDCMARAKKARIPILTP